MRFPFRECFELEFGYYDAGDDNHETGCLNEPDGFVAQSRREKEHEDRCEVCVYHKSRWSEDVFVQSIDSLFHGRKSVRNGQFCSLLSIEVT